jgi:hypothetical protein
MDDTFQELRRRISRIEDEMSQFSLQTLIERLKEEDPFQECNFGLVYPHCYRGYYREIGFTPIDRVLYIKGGIKKFKVVNILDDVEQVIGCRYEGYKGGFYRMYPHTKVWLSADSSVEDGTRFDDIIYDTMIDPQFSDIWKEIIKKNKMV